MDRRRFLAATAAGIVGSAAGCVEAFESATETTYGREPPLVDPRPAGIYWPTHTEQMADAGMGQTSDGRHVHLMYTFPHRFWRVFRGDGEGYETRIFEVGPNDAVHLMAAVWDDDSDVVLPVSSVDIAVTGDGVDERETVYPMLSQQMGFHYGDNYHLDADGSYTAEVTVGAVTAERFGAFEGRLDEPETVEIEFEYSESGRNDLAFEQYDDQAGQEGAVDPMAMDGMPLGTVRELGGDPMGEGLADDIRYRASLLDAERFGDEPYLAVTAATRYNELVVPDIGLSVTAEGAEGTQPLSDSLAPTLDPTVGFHYGVSAPGLTGDEELTVDVMTPAQVARHEGYETAFLTTPTVTLS